MSSFIREDGMGNMFTETGDQFVEMQMKVDEVNYGFIQSAVDTSREKKGEYMLLKSNEEIIKATQRLTHMTQVQTQFLETM